MSDRVFLSFDVEEFDLPLEYGQDISLDEQIESGLAGLEIVERLLNRLQVTSTLFCTGVLVEAAPDTIRRLSERHEIASHAWSHTSFDSRDPERSRAFLSEVTGRPVTGFRRPRLQPTDRGILERAGFRYDSSLNPIWLPGRYNNLASPRLPHRIGSLVEIPISTTPKLRLPLFWLAFKKVPLPIFQRWCDACLKADGQVNLFFHPWEFLELSRHRLPSLVAAPSGPVLLNKLESLLLWLKGRAAFDTFQTLADMFESEG